MLNIMPATTAIMPQFIHNLIIFNDYISIVRLQAVVFYIVLYCSVFILTYFMFMRKLLPHFVPCWHNYYTIKVFIKNIIKYVST